MANDMILWHTAVKRIPRSAVIPMGFGGVSDEANVSAFLGDKILGLQIARVQFENENNLSVENLTKFQSFLVSNELFSKHLRVILPDHVDEFIEKLAAEQKHTAGTMVEAAVAAVDKLGREEAYPAIENLAKWLVTTGGNSLQAEAFNAKGQLLNLGGILESNRLPGYPDHAPMFSAVAKLDGIAMHGEGASKRESEQIAARLLLAHIGVVNNELVSVQRYVIVPSPPDVITHEWKLFDPSKIQGYMAAYISDEESLPEWWVRGISHRKKAFHRMMMAPNCYPCIEKVDVWWKTPTPPLVNILAALQVTSPSSGERLVKSFTACGTSKTDAQAKVATLVNDFILQLVQEQEEKGAEVF